MPSGSSSRLCKNIIFRSPPYTGVPTAANHTDNRTTCPLSPLPCRACHGHMGFHGLPWGGEGMPTGMRVHPPRSGAAAAAPPACPFHNHQQQPIIVGELLADARRGLEIQHHGIFSDARIAILASLAPSLLARVRHNIAQQATMSANYTRYDIATFCATLVVCVNYALFCIAESGVRCQAYNLNVDRLHGTFARSFSRPRVTTGATRPTRPS
jgi:uncharacterized membrane protein